MTAPGPVISVLVELSLEGSSERDDGVRRIVQWTHRYWMAPGFLLPLKIETEEREDGLTVRRTMHEMIAVDTAVLAESR